MARKKISDNGIGVVTQVTQAARANGASRAAKSFGGSTEPLRLRGRREFITAMVDALNDILATERRIA